MKRDNMKHYRLVSLFLFIIFVMVGFIFLFMADGVLTFFNSIAKATGMELSAVHGVDFYLILATGYMYLVSLLAYMMFRHPDNYYFPLLLIHAKLASSLLSLGFFILHHPYPIYIINCVIDGSIGLLVLYFFMKLKKQQP
jgi:hypothetical protein